MRRPETIAARASWQQIDFISDLHLHAADPDTFATWEHYLRHTTAQAVFMLGDLFDVWIGDDILSQPADTPSGDARCATDCAQVLHQAGQRLDLFFICGNRDFLLGSAALQACAMQGLNDPCVLELGAARVLLSHGDALCLDDVGYQEFRALVRSPAWQSDFLRQPLEQRQQVARQLRAQSEQHKRAHPVPSQVDAPTVLAWLHDARASVLVHGHTHQPADHALADGKHRVVLSDWDMQATPPRAQVLRLTLDATGAPVSWLRLSPAQAC
ncbi:MAG: UDP-2,3-diacylglucosamine diphosphatase [Burkholderiaceae bacterium]